MYQCFIRSLIYSSLVVWTVCHSKRIKFFKGSGKPIPLQQQNLDDKYEISSELRNSHFSNHMIFQYDGVDVSSLWRLSRVWSSVEVTKQSRDRNVSVEILISYDENDHQRSPDAGLQHIYNFYHYIVCISVHALSYLVSNRDVSVDGKFITSIRINPIGQQFVKVRYHGSKPTAVFTITAKESIIDYHFPLCLTTGILLLVFTCHKPSLRGNSFLNETNCNVVWTLLSPFTALYKLCREFYRKYTKEVLLFCFVLIGTYCLVYWNQYNEIPWKSVFIEFIQFLNILRDTTCDDTTCSNLIRYIGIFFIFAATRLPEVSIVLSIVIPTCIFCPKTVYKFIKQSVEAILMYNREYNII